MKWTEVLNRIANDTEPEIDHDAESRFVRVTFQLGDVDA